MTRYIVWLDGYLPDPGRYRGSLEGVHLALARDPTEAVMAERDLWASGKVQPEPIVGRDAALIATYLRAQGFDWDEP